MNMNDGMVRMADMGLMTGMSLRNGRRERKRDQGDRGSQYAQDSLLQHHDAP